MSSCQSPPYKCAANASATNFTSGGVGVCSESTVNDGGVDGSESSVSDVKGDCPESSVNGKLCDLMVRLKLKNPELGRKDMFTAILADGPEWKDVKFDMVKRSWKKMMKQSTKEQEEITASMLLTTKERKKAAFEEQQSIMKQNAKDQEESGASSTGTSKEEIERAISRGKTMAAPVTVKSPALEKQLKTLKARQVNYVLFTPPSEAADYAIQLSNAMGEIFFRVMWNRVIEAPWGSPKIKGELWMIYQQLEASLTPRYKKLLRKQLQAEFGVDPFEGKNGNNEKSELNRNELTKAMNQFS